MLVLAPAFAFALLCTFLALAILGAVVVRQADRALVHRRLVRCANLTPIDIGPVHARAFLISRAQRCPLTIMRETPIRVDHVDLLWGIVLWSFSYGALI